MSEILSMFLTIAMAFGGGFVAGVAFCCMFSPCIRRWLSTGGGE